MGLGFGPLIIPSHFAQFSLILSTPLSLVKTIALFTLLCTRAKKGAL